MPTSCHQKSGEEEEEEVPARWWLEPLLLLLLPVRAAKGGDELMLLKSEAEAEAEAARDVGVAGASSRLLMLTLPDRTGGEDEKVASAVLMTVGVWLARPCWRRRSFLPILAACLACLACLRLRRLEVNSKEERDCSGRLCAVVDDDVAGMLERQRRLAIHRGTAGSSDYR